jgi:hypothetical protein
VAREAGELRQLPDLSMPWPADSDLRERFDKCPAEWLALAARAIYYTGHWFPSWGGPRLVLPGKQHGASWKFAHYADQSLRARLGMPERGDNGRDKGAVLRQVHEGAIRVCYQSPDTWTWREVAPATAGGLELANTRAGEVRHAIDQYKSRGDRDSAAHEVIEKWDKLAGFAADPSPWWPKLIDTERYMVEEGDQLERDPDAPPEDVAAKRRALIGKLTDAAEVKIEHMRTELQGQVWWIEHGIPIDNLIYYDHEAGGLFCFGWRREVGPELLGRILEVISEFPYPYRIKTADGRTLEGNIE